MEGAILTHTRAVAAELATRFADDPTGELEVWATTAQQREAMVVMLYDTYAVEQRLPKDAREPEVMSVVRKVIGGIWAQERSHTALVGSLRVSDENRLTVMRSVLGAMEGLVAHQATAPGWLRSLTSPLVGLSRAAGFAPEFTRAFRALTPRDFFRFSYELETTAKEGYERILELLGTLDDASTSLKFGVTGPYEFAKTLAEECFHAAVFEQLEQWLSSNGLGFVDVPAPYAVERLRALALEHLSLASPRFGPEARAALAIPWSKSLRDDRLVSDGGLGELFEEFEVPLPPIAAIHPAG